jgi:hypothetical protein
VHEIPELTGLFEMRTPVGSRITCTPPPMDTDQDWLYLTSDLARFVKAAEAAKFEVGGSCCDDDSSTVQVFQSLKRNDRINIIVTANKAFHDRFLAATHVARRLNLLNKPDRIALFQAVLYGNICTR